MSATVSPAVRPISSSDGSVAPQVRIVGLVRTFHAPGPSGARTRDEIPSGYGIAEQCLPFATAAACGLAIPSPFSWGVGNRDEIPPWARAFRSPVSGDRADPRWFYVLDDDALFFRGNRFRLMAGVATRIGQLPVPGLSFFDRVDQQNLVKVHLPYSWRTPADVATLFLPPINRPRTDGLRVLAGLVETDWYANPVNLVIEIPPSPVAVHVSAGDDLAHAVLVGARSIRPTVEVLEEHQRAARDQLDGIRSWHESHARDRSAYKRVARRRSGREADRGPDPG